MPHWTLSESHDVQFSSVDTFLAPQVEYTWELYKMLKKVFMHDITTPIVSDEQAFKSWRFSL